MVTYTVVTSLGCLRPRTFVLNAVLPLQYWGYLCFLRDTMEEIGSAMGVTLLKKSDLRVEDMFAERAAVEMVSVDVHEVFLQLVGLGEQLVTAGTAVLRRSGEKVGERMRLQLVVRVERHRTLLASVLQPY